MFISPRKGAIAGIVAVLILAACSANNSGTSTTPTATAPQSAMASESAAPTPVATVSSDQLLFADKLVICSDIPYPPQEFFDAGGNPVGSDIEIGQEIATRLGLTAEVQNSVFDTIIAALQGGKCDVIISAQNITTDRVKQVDMIPFFEAGQSFVVAKGNPKGIKTADDICGKTIAAETGTTEADYINGTGDYKGQGLSASCEAKGKGAITLQTFSKDSDALLALQSGHVDAYFADSPVAGYYVVQKPDLFELSGVELGVALEGISVLKDHQALRDAVQTALVSMINDGSYLNILKKYGDESGAITADVAGQLNKTS
jgi:polar amino acid transport system substrate-binding protein